MSGQCTIYVSPYTLLDGAWSTFLLCYNRRACHLSQMSCTSLLMLQVTIFEYLQSRATALNWKLLSRRALDSDANVFSPLCGRDDLDFVRLSLLWHHSARLKIFRPPYRLDLSSYMLSPHSKQLRTPSSTSSPPKHPIPPHYALPSSPCSSFFLSCSLFSELASLSNSFGGPLRC